MTEYQNDEKLERMVAQRAVELGLLTAARFTECMDLQSNMQSLKVDKSLREILLQKGYISKDIWQKLCNQNYREDAAATLPSIAEEIPENIESIFANNSEKSFWEPSFSEEKTVIMGSGPSVPETRISSISTKFLDNEITQVEVQIDDDSVLEISPSPEDKNSARSDEKTRVPANAVAPETPPPDDNAVDLDFSGTLLNDDEDFKTARQKKVEDQYLPPQIANAIPGYKLLSKLGGGAMGTIYRGLQISMEREVAVKILNKTVGANPQLVQRFIRECKAVARLNHENIVAGIDAGSTAEDIYYFVMEFIKGQSVGTLLQSQGKLSIRHALKITLQIANALEYARNQGIIHRDIKPDNMMVTAEGTAKLCDLGLAREIGKKSALTIVGHAIGTPQYISPEQAQGLENVDTRADIYSLGASLYHMVTGQPPFPNQSAAVVCTLHATKPLPNARKIEPSVPVEVNAIIQKCTQKSPEKRYQTPGALFKDLQAYLAHLSSLEMGKRPVDTAGAVSPGRVAIATPQQERPIDFAPEKPQTVDTSGIDFIEDVEEQKQIRRHHSQRAAMPGGNIKARSVPIAVATPPQSNENVMIACGIGAVLVILVALGYILYPMISAAIKKGKPPAKQPSLVNQIIEEKPEEKKERQQLREMLLLWQKNFPSIYNGKEVAQRIKKYQQLLQQHRGKKLESEIASAQKTFLARLDQMSKQEYAARQQKAEQFENNYSRNEDPFHLKQIYGLWREFPEGLRANSPWQEKINGQKQKVCERIDAIYYQDNQKANVLKKEKKFQKARKLYQRILNYALPEQLVKAQEAQRQLQQILEQYQKKYGPKIFDRFAQAILANNNQELEHLCANVEKHDALADTLFSLRQRLQIREQLPRLQSQLSARELANSNPQTLWLRVAPKSNEFSPSDRYWSLGYIYMHYRLWDKAAESFRLASQHSPGQVEKTDRYSQYIELQRNIDRAQGGYQQIKASHRQALEWFAAGKFAKAQAEFRQARRLWQRINHNARDYLGDKRNHFAQLGVKIDKDYLRRYALTLYFRQSFSEIPVKDNGYKFAIQYAFTKASRLNDFNFVEHGCRKSNGKQGLSIRFSDSHGVFEMYWNGKMTAAKISAQITTGTGKIAPANIGAFIYKKERASTILDKYLGLLGFDFERMRLAEKKNRGGYAADSTATPGDHRSNQLVICYLRGKPGTLQYRSAQDVVKASASLPSGKSAASYRIIIGASGNNIHFVVKNGARRHLQCVNTMLGSGYSGLYANGDVDLSQIEIEGKLDPSWVKKAVIQVIRQRSDYLRQDLSPNN